jgi:hypothetical protein
MSTLESSLVPATQRADEFRLTFDLVVLPLLSAGVFLILLPIFISV